MSSSPSCNPTSPRSSALRRAPRISRTRTRRAAAFYCRLALETAIGWPYWRERTLKSPFEPTLAAPSRTVIALADLLMRANWAKRILIPCRPQGAGAAGRQRLQGAPRGRRHREPAGREASGGSRLRLDLSNHRDALVFSI